MKEKKKNFKSTDLDHFEHFKFCLLSTEKVGCISDLLLLFMYFCSCFFSHKQVSVVMSCSIRTRKPHLDWSVLKLGENNPGQ